MESESLLTVWRLVAAASAFASGCAFSIDASVIKPSSDAGAPDPTEDGGAMAALPDAGEDASGDIWEPVNPCRAGNCRPACDADSECEEGEYCSLERAGCVPRCDATRGCAGPRLSVESLVGDGQTVYIATRYSGTDVLGNPRSNSAIWAWNLSDDPVLIASGLLAPRLLFVADDLLYYVEDGFRRIRTQPGSSPELVESPTGGRTSRMWKTESYVYWSIDKKTSFELWRQQRDLSSAAELVTTANHRGWLAGNDEVVYHLEWQASNDTEVDGRIVSEQLSDLTIQREIFDGFATEVDSEVLLVGSTFYFTSRSKGLNRIDLEQPGSWSAASRPGQNTRFVEKDGWIYWSTECDSERNLTPPETICVGRTHGDLLFEPSLLLEYAQASGSPGLAMTDRHLVYERASEGRLFSFQIPALPCSTDVDCPAGELCGAEMQCE